MTQSDITYEDLFPKGYTPGIPYTAPGPSIPYALGAAAERSRKTSRLEVMVYDAIANETKIVANAIGHGAQALGSMTMDLGTGTCRLVQRSAIMVGRELERDALSTAHALENIILLKDPQLRDILAPSFMKEYRLKKANDSLNNQTKKQPVIFRLSDKNIEPIRVPSIITGADMRLAQPINQYGMVAIAKEQPAISPLQKALLGAAFAATIGGAIASYPNLNLTKADITTIMAKMNMNNSPISAVSIAPATMLNPASTLLYRDVYTKEIKNILKNHSEDVSNYSFSPLEQYTIKYALQQVSKQLPQASSEIQQLQLVKTIWALGKQESNYQQDSVSKKNAIGVFQLTKGAVEDMGGNWNLAKKDAKYNIQLGVKKVVDEIAEYYDKTNDIDTATWAGITGYNFGKNAMLATLNAKYQKKPQTEVLETLSAVHKVHTTKVFKNLANYNAVLDDYLKK